MIGIDYASVANNSEPDWRAAKRAGASFAIVRGSHAVYSKSKRQWFIQPDDHYLRDWNKIPLVKGAYLFPEPRAKEGPAEQVAVFAKAVKLKEGVDLPPVLDIEFPGGLNGRTRAQMLQWMKDAVEALQDAYGANPILYTSARVWDGEDTDALNADTMMELVSTLKQCPLWLARYPYAYNLTPKPAPEDDPPVPRMWGKGNLWIHQYQGNVKKMPGFSGLVDLNKFKIMKIGEKGERVKWVQVRLGIKQDGIFGPGTQKAVVAFQAKKKLKADGVIGPGTFAALAWV